MATWWLWRLKPDPKKFIREIELDIGYVDPSAVPIGGLTERDILQKIEAALKPLAKPGRASIRLHLDGSGNIDGHVRESPIGVMRAFKVESMVHRSGTGGTYGTAARRTRYAYWMTPPVVQFADLSKHFTADQLRDMPGGHRYGQRPDYTYWANAEVVAAAGQFLRGGLAGVHQTAKLQDLQMVAGHRDNEIGQFLLVALDAFLETHKTDPRFNPRGKAPRRKNAPTTVDDVIQVAMDTVEEKKPDWFLVANRILRSVNADYLGRRNKNSPIVVAQCIRDIEGPEKTIQGLYRIWGDSKLKFKPIPSRQEPAPGPRDRYVIVSSSTRMRAWGETAIYPATRDDVAIENAAWPMAVEGQDNSLGGGANYSVLSHNEALIEVGVTHVVPCDAMVMNPPGGSAPSVRASQSIASIRAQLAARTERCTEGCQGWDVFDTDRGLEIEACDECNNLAVEAGLPRVYDEDVRLLPEAQAALRETQARWDIEAGATE